jgi:nickel/cobalt transporter (NiCoT) family protein
MVHGDFCGEEYMSGEEKMSSNFGVAALAHVFQESASGVRRRVIGIYVLLVAYNLLAWLLAIIAFAHIPSLLFLAGTAYIFGMRHAFDADHISAIDNVTRKLMQEHKRPVGVGFFFSLGHSTIVVILTVLIALATVAISNFDALKNIGGLIGTTVSALFLFLIAIINIVILVDIYKTFREVSQGGAYNDQSLNELLNRRGLMGRFFRPLLRMTDQSWKMYPIGVLFGLGFDTATEVGLLGIAATTAGHIPVIAILIFPMLFTAGMTIMDTTDSILMLGAYGWAFVKPIRKLYYNLNITLISVIVALVIGAIEVLGIISGPPLNLTGPFWDEVGNLNDNFGYLGVIIVLLFLASWAISTIVYKVKKYDDIEVVAAPNVNDSHQ